MFSKFRSKLREPFGVKPAAEQNDDAGGQDPFIAQITNLEGLVNKRTKDLQEAQEQLKKLSGATQDSTEDIGEIKAEGLFTRPNQPKEELVVQPEEQTPDTEKKAEAEKEPASSLEVTGEEKEEEQEQSDEEQDDSMSSLFSQEEEEENPLSALLSSLPDITASELLAEAQEITAMMRVSQRN